MGQEKHTEGPWKTYKSKKYPNDIFITTGKEWVAKAYGSEENHEKMNANAHLIAAAPELLGALIELQSAIYQHESDEGITEYDDTESKAYNNAALNEQHKANIKTGLELDAAHKKADAAIKKARGETS